MGVTDEGEGLRRDILGWFEQGFELARGAIDEAGFYAAGHIVILSEALSERVSARPGHDRTLAGEWRVR